MGIKTHGHFSEDLLPLGKRRRITAACPEFIEGQRRGESILNGMEFINVKKIGMTQIFDERNRLVPVTIVEVLLSKDEKAVLPPSINVEIGNVLRVQGISKGKGFQGAMKKHGAHGAPASHGRKHDMRRVGSIGSGWPERVMKGKKMPGRMGSKRVTIKNLPVIRVDKVNSLIAMKGSIPGARGCVVKVQLS